MIEREGWQDADWPNKLQDAHADLTAALHLHATRMAAWSEEDLAGLEAINAGLRRAFQAYEDLLAERTGTLIDVGRVEDSDDQSGEVRLWPDATWVTVMTRHDYRLATGEELNDFNPAGREFTAGLQVTFVPDLPLPVDDPGEWPPESFQEWMTTQGRIIHEDIFDPLL